MRIPLLAWRVLAEHESQPVAVIDRAMARGFWHDAPADAIGRRIMPGAPRPGAAWLTIVGVVGRVRNAGLDTQPLPQMYVPELAPARSPALVLRTDHRRSLAPRLRVRGRIFALDPNQPLYDVKTMDEREQAAAAQSRFQTVLLG